jgi:hypothetical protein
MKYRRLDRMLDIKPLKYIVLIHLHLRILQVCRKQKRTQVYALQAYTLQFTTTTRKGNNY